MSLVTGQGNQGPETFRSELDTHNIICPFGKYEGQPITRIPVHYLHWAVESRVDVALVLTSGTVPFHEVAKAEIERRGERLHDISISGHAIDRMSLKHLKIWRENRKDEEGLLAWMQRAGLEAWKNRWTLPAQHQDDNHWKVFHLGIEWVFEELAIPVVKTVV